MFCFCTEDHHSCVYCREPPCLPMSSSEPPSSQAATQQLQVKPSCAVLHDQLGGCKGAWIYVCYQHMVTMDPAAAYALHHPPPASPSPCCCRRFNPSLSDNKLFIKIPDEKKNFTHDKPSVRVSCKVKTNFSLTVRDGQVILAPTDPTDIHQHWIKDEKLGINVKDEEGQYSSFALVNKATGEAIKHSISVGYPVQLTEYNPDKLDESVMWTLSKKIFRPISNFDLHLDAEKGIKEYGGVKYGTKIILWEWNDGDNQKWTTISY